MALLDDLDKRREIVARHRENSSRLAQSYAIFKTTGQGSMQWPDRVDFGLTFVEKPVMSYGSECDVDDLAVLENIDDSDDAILPLCSGHVVNWDMDNRGFYVGCWVAVRVNFPISMAVTDAVDPTMQPEIYHHFTFAGIGMKDIQPIDPQ